MKLLVIISIALGTTLPSAWLLLCVFVPPSDRWQHLSYVPHRSAVPSEVLLRLEYCVTHITDTSEKLPRCTALRSVNVELQCARTVQMEGLSVMVVTVQCDDRLPAAGLPTL